MGEWLFLLLGLGSLFGGGVVSYLVWWGWMRPGPSTTDQTILIQEGATLNAVGKQLERAGLIRYWRIPTLIMRLPVVGGQVRAGEYTVVAKSSPREIFNKLLRGDAIVRKFTVIEGETSAHVMERLRELEGVTWPPGDFELPRDGSLFASTYHFSFGNSVDTLLNSMREALSLEVTSLLQEQDRFLRNNQSNKPLQKRYAKIRSADDVIKLASIVQAEAANLEEMPRIAGVFVNRLARNMRLESDPTVIYAVTNGLQNGGYVLSRRDLAQDHPYNSYRVRGLPPGPIGNPGLSALRAAALPGIHDELYFVADGQGGHWFAKTFSEHNDNVAKYRAIQREQAKEQ